MKLRTRHHILKYRLGPAIKRVMEKIKLNSTYGKLGTRYHFTGGSVDALKNDADGMARRFNALSQDVAIAHTPHNIKNFITP